MKPNIDNNHAENASFLDTDQKVNEIYVQNRNPVNIICHPEYKENQTFSEFPQLFQTNKDTQYEQYNMSGNINKVKYEVVDEAMKKLNRIKLMTTPIPPGPIFLAVPELMRHVPFHNINLTTAAASPNVVSSLKAPNTFVPGSPWYMHDEPRSTVLKWFFVFSNIKVNNISIAKFVLALIRKLYLYDIQEQERVLLGQTQQIVYLSNQAKKLKTVVPQFYKLTKTTSCFNDSLLYFSAFAPFSDKVFFKNFFVDLFQNNETLKQVYDTTDYWYILQKSLESTVATKNLSNSFLLPTCIELDYYSSTIVGLISLIFKYYVDAIVNIIIRRSQKTQDNNVLTIAKISEAVVLIKSLSLPGSRLHRKYSDCF